MKSVHLLATLFISAGIAAPAFADHHMPKTSAGLEKCIKAALKAKGLL